MKGKRKTKEPCDVCGLNPDLCLCEDLPVLDLKTRLLLVVHHRELKRPTNSGRLAVAALKNSAMRIRGVIGGSLDLTPELSPDYESLLFFPSEEAQELNEDFVKSLKKPAQLIVPDGNWRQASKVGIRHPELKNLRRVMLRVENKAKHHLRKENSEFGMSTLEAIARAFGVLEGAEAGEALMRLYQRKLAATLEGRGVRTGV